MNKEVIEHLKLKANDFFKVLCAQTNGEWSRKTGEPGSAGR